MIATGQSPSIPSPWRIAAICSLQRVGCRLDFIKVFGLLTKVMKFFVFLVLCLYALAPPGMSPGADAAASSTYSVDQPSSADLGSAMDCCAIGSCNNGCIPNAHCVQGCLASVGLTAAAYGVFSAPSRSFASVAVTYPIATNLPPDPYPP